MPFLGCACIALILNYCILFFVDLDVVTVTAAICYRNISVSGDTTVELQFGIRSWIVFDNYSVVFVFLVVNV